MTSQNVAFSKKFSRKCNPISDSVDALIVYLCPNEIPEKNETEVECHACDARQLHVGALRVTIYCDFYETAAIVIWNFAELFILQAYGELLGARVENAFERRFRAELDYEVSALEIKLLVMSGSHVRKSCPEVMSGSHVRKSCVRKSCPEVMCPEVMCPEVTSGRHVRKSCPEVKCPEVMFGSHVWKPCVRKSCSEVMCPEIMFGSHVSGSHVSGSHASGSHVQSTKNVDPLGGLVCLNLLGTQRIFSMVSHSFGSIHVVI